jgi:hypothetical protein
MAPRQVVVDGSNIATEGRSSPSLAQLDQAVREFLSENPDAVLTVVVDASFAHRIEPSELKTFEEAEAAGELVSPPAGAIGRGDAFLLRIADKTGALVLSNDSFQEFHGEHEWLFDKGRLIGGKPVPGVGWIFTPRTPVRGPRSREAVKEAKRKKKGDADTSPGVAGLDLAAERARAMGKGKRTVERAIAVATEEAVTPRTSKRRRRRKGGVPPSEAVNDPLTFITFIAAHPLGSEVVATVESFASHGAFVDVDGARCYVPLSAMGLPAPKSAREVLTKGEHVGFVIQALDPQRRGIELALPAYAKVAGAPTDETVEAEIAGEGAAPPTEAAEPTAPVGLVEVGAGHRPAARRAGARPPEGVRPTSVSTVSPSTPRRPRSRRPSSVGDTGPVPPVVPPVSDWADAPAAAKPGARRRATTEALGGTAGQEVTGGASGPGGLRRARRAATAAPVKKAVVRKAGVKKVGLEQQPIGQAGVEPAPEKKAAGTATAAAKAAPREEPAPRAGAPAKTAAVRKTAAAVRTTAAAEAPAGKAPAKEPAGTAVAVTKTPIRKATAKRAPAKETPVKKEPVKEPAVVQPSARKAAPAKKAPASKAAPAKTAPAKKAPPPKPAPAPNTPSAKKAGPAKKAPSAKKAGPATEAASAKKAAAPKAAPAKKAPAPKAAPANKAPVH